MKKAILPVVLSMFMVFTMMPAQAFAASLDAAVKAVADGNGDSSVTVKDQSTEKEEEIGPGTASVTVTGAEGTGDHEMGAVAYATNNGKAEVTVEGDVSSEKSYGVYANANAGGTATVTVEGSVESKGAVDGLHLSSQGQGSSANVEVKEDVQSEAAGLYVDPYPDSGSKIDVLINGTLKGDTAGVRYVGDNADNYNNAEITVWKIEKGTDGKLFQYGRDEASGESLVGIRNHVHYIVKLEQSEGATLSATKADGSALDKMHDLGTATTNDGRVLLKVDLKPGYKLDGAYNGKGEKVALLQDENGNYYVDVKDGGGIYLSVAVSKTQHNISYNLDGGSYNGQIGTITQVYDYGTAIKLLGTPTREGYRFLYWRGSQYDAGADYTVEGDHLFTAVWEKIVPKDNDDSDDVVKTSVTNTKTASKASPATGDESGLVIWISILAVAVIALVYAFVRRREYNK